MTPAVLAQHDVTILGEMSLSGPQVDDLTDWVQAGGNLIAMRPDPQLAGLLGLATAGGTLANAYLLVDTTAAPGAGHRRTRPSSSTAPPTCYTLSGAQRRRHLVLERHHRHHATPRSRCTASVRTAGRPPPSRTTWPAPIVYTRQGNPAWAGQERDGDRPIRRRTTCSSAPRPATRSPTGSNLDKVAIPQADEQQRLLANLILQMNADRKPLPAVLVPPARREGGRRHDRRRPRQIGGTVGRFDQLPRGRARRAARSPTGSACRVDLLHLHRAPTLTDAPRPRPTAPRASRSACTPNSNDSQTGRRRHSSAYFDGQLAALAQQLPEHPPRPTRVGRHRVAWSDWAAD